MRNFILHIALLLVIPLISGTKQSYAQSVKPFLTGLPREIPTGIFLRGTIRNYANQPLLLYQCYGDTLLLIDSTHTDKSGEFTFSIPKSFNPKNHSSDNVAGLCKIILQRNQWFYILCDGNPIEIKTLYQPNAFYNIATDSLTVVSPLRGDGMGADENKKFYEFQKKQQQLNVANHVMLQMLRLYPLYDPFHKQIEEEYFARYDAMDEFVKRTVIAREERPKQSVNNLAGLVALSYYQPVNPDWKQPDPWRDSIIALHYFDYFNPADSFYLHTNILPEKMDIYLALRTNKRDNYGQPIYDEMLFAAAAQQFLEKTKNNDLNFKFCLQYFLKKFNKEHKDNAFLFLYDTYLKTAEGDCGTKEADVFHWVREKTSIMKGVQTGSAAPDFEIEKGKLSLSFLQSDYTLLLFWATWCPHCTQAVPEIKKVVEKFNQENGKKLLTVAVSLDTDREQWQKFVTENNLLSFLNFSELKGWQSEVVKKYNVYATPSMFLLDKDKKIIAKPETTEQLINALSTQTTNNK